MIDRTTSFRALVAAFLALAPFGAAPVAAQSLPIVSPRFGAPEAPSALTVALLAKARPTVAVLERGSVLATEKAGRRLRGFARAEAADEAKAGAALAASAAPTLVTADPLDVAAVAAAGIDEGAETILSALPRLLRTPGARAIAADRAIAGRGAADLARLAESDGAAFDALYVETERAGLRRLQAIYRDYVENGDDLALIAVAVPELRRVRARLAALGRD
jgi:hypothetical protein